MYVSLSLSIYIYIYIHIYMCICVCVCIYIYIYTYLSLSLSIYIYMYIYIYIYTHIFGRFFPNLGVASSAAAWTGETLAKRAALRPGGRGGGTSQVYSRVRLGWARFYGEYIAALTRQKNGFVRRGTWWVLCCAALRCALQPSVQRSVA